MSHNEKGPTSHGWPQLRTMKLESLMGGSSFHDDVMWLVVSCHSDTLAWGLLASSLQFFISRCPSHQCMSKSLACLRSCVVCVRACVRVCVCACVCLRGCVGACVCVYVIYEMNTHCLEEDEHTLPGRNISDAPVMRPKSLKNHHVMVVMSQLSVNNVISSSYHCK
jgi:hypothetical protein